MIIETREKIATMAPEERKKYLEKQYSAMSYEEINEYKKQKEEEMLKPIREQIEKERKEKMEQCKAEMKNFKTKFKEAVKQKDSRRIVKLIDAKYCNVSDINRSTLYNKPSFKLASTFSKELSIIMPGEESYVITNEKCSNDTEACLTTFELQNLNPACKNTYNCAINTNQAKKNILRLGENGTELFKLVCSPDNKLYALFTSSRYLKNNILYSVYQDPFSGIQRTCQNSNF